MSARLAQSASAAIIALAAAGTLMAPTAASAQSYGYVPGYGDSSYGQSYRNTPAQLYGQGYDRRYDDRSNYGCDRYRQGRTGAGATIGASIGAIAGSQLAARGRRTEGSILGGVLGAVVGGQVGRSSSTDSCSSGGYYYGDQSYGQGNGYNQSGRYYDQNSRYGSDRYANDSRYDDRYRDDRYQDDRRYSSGYATGSSYGTRSGYGSSSSYGSTGVQISADGHYWYDPNYGWRPR